MNRRQILCTGCRHLGGDPAAGRLDCRRGRPRLTVSTPNLCSRYEPAVQPQPNIEDVPQLTLFASPGP